MKKLYHGFCWIEETLCNIGFGAMIALVFISAIARNLGRPLAWSIDVAQLMLCWTTLIGADVAFRHGKFLGLDLVTRRLPIKVQRALALVIDFLILGALIIFIIYGFRLSAESWKRSFQTLKLSYSWVTLALPVMSIFMSVSDVLDIISKIKQFNAPVEEKVQPLEGGETA